MSTRLLLEGGDLATLLRRVRGELGPGARVVAAERVRSGGFAGFFAREHFELTIEMPDPVEAPADRTYAARQAQASATVGIEALLDAADAEEARIPEVSTGGAAFADVLEQVRALVGEGAAPAAPASAHVVSKPPAPEPDAVPAPTLAHRLATVGVPERLLVDEPRSLSQALAAIPSADEPVRTPGAVLAVVGAAADVDAVGRLLAERLHLDPAAVVPGGTVAARADVPQPRGRGTRLRPTGPEEAVRWRQGAERAPHPWVVALAVGHGPDERAQAAQILEALRADQTWAVVDARTKTVDARAWMTGVGTFDAVAVRGAFDTAQPGSLLDLGAPVAWLDGIPATHASWAALLDRALDGAGGWD